MNAYAALLAGIGGAVSAGSGVEPGLLTEGPTGQTLSGDDPDFFAVLQGTLDGEVSGEVADDTRITSGRRAARRGSHEAPVEIDTQILGAEWFQSLELGDDRIPLLEIEIPTSEVELPLTDTGNGGVAGSEIRPLLPLDPSLLAGTVTGGQAAEITFASPTLNLGATVGESSPYMSATGPMAEPPNASLLTTSAGEPGGIVEATPAIVADPDLSLIDPALRSRVATVIDRMRTEYGHNVKVVEGFRTPERQSALFAQGRSAPGQVVTWTQNSLHSEGLAVDVIVDGSYAPHEGYRRLARIAKEEGLQTLGAKDPGHLQLANTNRETEVGGERFARIADVARTAVPATQAQPSEPARVALQASIAEPASVAQPATISQPAEVALPGSDGVPIRSDPPELGTDRLALEATAGEGKEQAIPSLATTNSRTTADDEGPFGQRVRTLALARAALRREERTGKGTSRPVGSMPAAEVDPRLGQGAQSEALSQAPTVKTPSVVSAETLHRVTQVRELQELAYPKKLGQVTLRMLDGMSEEARMRVSLMGDGIDTSIGVRDLAQADRMRSRIGVLEQALRQRGLEPIATRVGAIAGSATIDAAALTAQAVTSARLPAQADAFMNGSGSDTNTTQDDFERTPEDREPRQQPREQKQENPR